VIPQLIAQYVSSGEVRYVYREFPIQSHVAARAASLAAVCAGFQDSYWEMNEQLFTSVGEWGAQGVDPSQHFAQYARDLGLDGDAFARCLDSDEAAAIIQTDLQAGQAFGVNATPYFFINDIPVRGGMPIEPLGAIIEYVAAGGEVLPEIVPTDGDWRVQGDPQTAGAVAVAFVDYTSPTSRLHALEVLPQLVSNYISEGQLVYVVHPLSEHGGGPSARAAAAAECAGHQGKYAEMSNQLFSEQDEWTTQQDVTSLYAGYADSLGLDVSGFETCLDSDWATLRVLSGALIATLYGVQEGPVFLFNDGEGPRSLSSFDEFQAVIEAILGQQ
jgi:protein-disulfide isomerase